MATRRMKGILRRLRMTFSRATISRTSWGLPAKSFHHRQFAPSFHLAESGKDPDGRNRQGEDNGIESRKNTCPDVEASLRITIDEVSGLNPQGWPRGFLFLWHLNDLIDNLPISRAAYRSKSLWPDP